MAYFAIQVRSKAEEKLIAHARGRQTDIGERLFFLRRSLRIRRAGRWREETAPVFTGYVFLRADQIDPDTAQFIRSLPGFIRFLPATDRIKPLSERDESLVRHFLSFGEVLKKSVVEFDENKRIKVISGPLKGLDGQIVKVDRRKKRARVRLELYKDTFEIDFGFEALEPSPQPAPADGQG